jgi:5-oxoprolinase (ATP-hydrolysing)
VLRPLDIVLPAGSLLNPAYPAAVVAGNVETSQNIVDALYGALGALAASQGSMNNFSFGDGRYQYYETVCGGAGAGPGFAGASAVHSHMTNSRLTDPEVMELNFPVRLESFGIRRGSGGAGQFPGGDGVERRIRFLAPMQANLLALRRQVAPFGMAGGEAGKTGRQWIERADGGGTSARHRRIQPAHRRSVSSANAGRRRFWANRESSTADSSSADLATLAPQADAPTT